jgi:transcriptional regulator with XRE-family HTH domain
MKSARDKERRQALREELHARVAAGEIGLVEAVRTMRRIAGKSQTEYARLVGVSPRVLMAFERGVGNPTLKTIEKLLAPFDLEVTVRRRRREGGLA